MTIYFLGGGNMASAIASGLVKQGGYTLHIANRSAEKRAHLAATLGVTVSETLPSLTQHDILILAVKPQDMQNACAAVQTNGALVLSVAAGLSIHTLSHYLGGNQRIIRIMPNTPSQVGLGIAGIYAPPHLSEHDKQQAETIMRTTGEVVWLNSEQQIHHITGISGSGPAYVFYLMNALQQAAIAQGFNLAEARQLSLNTFKGAVALAEQSGEDFSTLQQKVTSKGGTTHEAITCFQSHQVAEAIQAGVNACVARSQAIAQQFEQPEQN